MARKRNPPKPEGSAGSGRTSARENTRRERKSQSAGDRSVPPLRLAASVEPHDLGSPIYYLNRELTWLAFNRRVLHEAEDDRTPVLERLKFLSIVSSNLDEFFMKRIGGLKVQESAGVHQVTVDGRTPYQQIEECYAEIRTLDARLRIVHAELMKLLARNEIRVVGYEDLGPKKQAALREKYVDTIFPLVTPQAMDPAHPFPFISNLSLNLLLTVRYPGEETTHMARVKVPVGSGIPRFLSTADGGTFVPLEDVMAHNLDLLVPGMEIDRCELFRVTRNANAERDEGAADDLLALIESELRDRKFAPIVRLEVAKGMDRVHRGMLAAELELDEESDVFEVEGMLGMRDLMQLADLDVPTLRDAPHQPVDHPKLIGDRNIFHTIRDEGAVLLHHPYESFRSSVERFLRDASEDPKVRAIKMTVYRTSEDSNVIAHLKNAARNGKQVAVAVELKARFDEDANIEWASQMEEAGVHVTYGVVGLKTHCKVILVVRQDYDGLRRYSHIGTGNYHAGTSRLYSDLGLLTCDDEIGRDLTELFNYLTTGYKPKRKYSKILPAPAGLKSALIVKIDREIESHSADSPGLIQIKMNALEDADLCKALYRASRAGVRVDLIIRDTCRLRPGIPGLSESIRVLSIVGRFLEHARIVYFHNGGEPEYYIGSADFMKRNLESRVEALVPVEDPRLQDELRYILDAQLQDSRSAWDMHSDGSYVQRTPSKPNKERGCQNALISWANKRHKDATRLRKRKPKGRLRTKRNRG